MRCETNSSRAYQAKKLKIHTQLNQNIIFANSKKKKSKESPSASNFLFPDPACRFLKDLSESCREMLSYFRGLPRFFLANSVLTVPVFLKPDEGEGEEASVNWGRRESKGCCGTWKLLEFCCCIISLLLWFILILFNSICGV